ncbi:MAG TPA: hypothetical protein VHJ76_07090, partial [Actinomycetota bacterium]|nr:hypothetical protein [Actinomycetota bacterium]
AEPAPPPPEPDAVIWREQVKARLFNRAILLILLAGLLVTAMNQLYFDDDVYGTWSDYFVTLTWGFGSVFTVDAFSTALDKLGARIASR